MRVRVRLKSVSHPQPSTPRPRRWQRSVNVLPGQPRAGRQLPGDLRHPRPQGWNPISSAGPGAPGALRPGSVSGQSQAPSRITRPRSECWAVHGPRTGRAVETPPSEAAAGPAHEVWGQEGGAMLERHTDTERRKETARLRDTQRKRQLPRAQDPPECERPRPGGAGVEREGGKRKPEKASQVERGPASSPQVPSEELKVMGRGCALGPWPLPASGPSPPGSPGPSESPCGLCRALWPPPSASSCSVLFSKASSTQRKIRPNLGTEGCLCPGSGAEAP